jgi:hypothetical protein
VSERASPSKIKKILTTKKIQKFVFVPKRKERERERESAVWCRLLEKKKKNCVETSGNQWLRFD